MALRLACMLLLLSPTEQQSLSPSPSGSTSPLASTSPLVSVTLASSLTPSPFWTISPLMNSKSPLPSPSLSLATPSGGLTLSPASSPTYTATLVGSLSPVSSPTFTASLVGSLTPTPSLSQSNTPSATVSITQTSTHTETSTTTRSPYSQSLTATISTVPTISPSPGPTTPAPSPTTSSTASTSPSPPPSPPLGVAPPPPVSTPTPSPSSGAGGSSTTSSSSSNTNSSGPFGQYLGLGIAGICVGMLLLLGALGAFAWWLWHRPAPAGGGKEGGGAAKVEDPFGRDGGGNGEATGPIISAPTNAQHRLNPLAHSLAQQEEERAPQYAPSQQLPPPSFRAGIPQKKNALFQHPGLRGGATAVGSHREGDLGEDEWGSAPTHPFHPQPSMQPHDEPVYRGLASASSSTFAPPAWGHAGGGGGAGASSAKLTSLPHSKGRVVQPPPLPSSKAHDSEINRRVSSLRFMLNPLTQAAKAGRGGDSKTSSNAPPPFEQPPLVVSRGGGGGAHPPPPPKRGSPTVSFAPSKRFGQD